jgi:hypothetical protein
MDIGRNDFRFQKAARICRPKYARSQIGSELDQQVTAFASQTIAARAQKPTPR